MPLFQLLVAAAWDAISLTIYLSCSYLAQVILDIWKPPGSVAAISVQPQGPVIMKEKLRDAQKIVKVS